MIQADSSIPPNPFTQRGAITDPDQFHGRKTELRTIFGQLAKMQSVSVIGERRIGKSSLLHYIVQAGQERLPADVSLKRLDMQSVSDEADFFSRLLEAMGAPGETLRDVERAIGGKQVIVCLDEFEEVIDQPAFHVGFFNGLRALAGRSPEEGRLAWVTATRGRLADLVHEKQFATSTFWNLFRPVNLGLFTAAEANRFIHVGFARSGITIAEAEQARILQLAGRYPFFLQLACFHLFEQKIGQISGWQRGFHAEARDHLRYLWEHRTPQERAVLRRVIELDDRLLPGDAVCQELLQRGLLVQDRPDPSGFWFFSQSFEDVVRNPPRKRRILWKVPFGSIKVEITLTPPFVKVSLEAGRTAGHGIH
jgi:hypothetical protein